MGRAVPGETSTIMKVFAVLLLAALAYAAPEAEPEADAAADAWYSYYGYGHPGYYGAYRYGLDMDGVDTMVDITGTPDTDTDTGSVMLKLKLNLRLRLKPTLPSSTPASTAMDLPTDTLIMAMELTPALTTPMLMLPPSTPMPLL